MLLRPRLTPAEDKGKLIEAIDAALSCWSTYAPNLDRFRREIRRSHAVPPWDVPIDMVTMGSRFVLRNHHTGENICYSLVYPNQEGVYEGGISVLSPMGMAVHGTRVGERLAWLSAAGPELASIKQLLYQPERLVERQA